MPIQIKNLSSIEIFSLIVWIIAFGLTIHQMLQTIIFSKIISIDSTLANGLYFIQLVLPSLLLVFLVYRRLRTNKDYKLVISLFVIQLLAFLIGFIVTIFKFDLSLRNHPILLT